MARVSDAAPAEKTVDVGELIGLHGVKGWLTVRSHCEPWEAIFDYSPWLVRGACIDDVEGRRHGSKIICRLPGVDDRDSAGAYVGEVIRVPRSALPDPAPGEWYWADLVGLRVKTPAGVELGRVERVFATGANDVLVVRGSREHLVPLVAGRYVLDVNLETGVLVADWDPAF